jgi:hypothetical protein
LTVKGLASPLELAWPGGPASGGLAGGVLLDGPADGGPAGGALLGGPADGELLGLGAATVMVVAGGPLLAAVEDTLLVSEAVVTAAVAGTAIGDAEDRLLVTTVAAGEAVEAVFVAGGVGLPLCSAIA